MKVVKHRPLESPICRDADDDNILAAAVAGLCDYIITGDNDLLEIRQYKNIQILNPRMFAELES